MPLEYAHQLLAQALIRRENYAEAATLLEHLIKRHASPEALWLLIQAYRRLGRPAHIQHDALLQFVGLSQQDERAGLAWKMIGDLRGEQLGDGMAAIRGLPESRGVRAGSTPINAILPRAVGRNSCIAASPG